MGFLSVMAGSISAKAASNGQETTGKAARLVQPEPVRHREAWSGRDGILSSSSNDRRSPSRKTEKAGNSGKRSAIDPAYDRWLDQTLHQIYDPVLSEAIPDEMAKLLLQFEERPEKGSKDEEQQD